MRFSKANDVKLPDMRHHRHAQDDDAQVKLCEAPNCTEHGTYPAPKNRDALRDYRYFCLDHVRDYNKKWNYFSGLEDDALEKAIRDASTWERPSWKFGTSGKQPSANGAKASFRPEDLDDIFGFFDEDVTTTKAAALDALDPEERKAWALFGIDPTTDNNVLKKRYNQLVKLHHPDRHNGDPKAEEKLKEINLAYALLRNKLATK